MTIEELDQNIIVEAQKEMERLLERNSNEEVTQEIEVVDWIPKISYLVEKVDSIYELLNKEVKETEEKIDSLDGIVYISPILQKGAVLSPPLIKVGTVDESGVVEFFPIETHAPIVPSLYKPDFYYVCLDIDKNHKRYGLNNIRYKKFTPKNSINQILITKEDITYTTGYIDSNGVAIYYDQLPKY